MIAIFETNNLISALLNPHALPAKLVDEWTEQRFTLATCEEQIAEFRRVSRYPKIASLLPAPRAGRLVRRMRDRAAMFGELPAVDRCRDPHDNFLLAMAQTANAHFLVTGDKADLLVLGSHKSTRIVTAREFADIIKI
jgi:putative PIN family toxin of toxin-antitoxin system